MNDLITSVNNVPVLNTATITMLVDLDRRKKEIEAAEGIIRNAVLCEMREKNITKVESEELTISYVAPTDKESFDSKSFRADHPDMYDEYVKISPVKDSIRIKVKDGKLED